LHSQKIQPLTEFPVIDTAAAEGDKNLVPLTIKAPLWTVPLYILPLYVARNSVPFGNVAPFVTHETSSEESGWGQGYV